MPSFWNPGDRARLLQRMDRLSPPRAPRWGTMNVEQMVVHVTAQLEMALGDIAALRHASWMSRWPIRDIVIRWAPWPRNAPTAPELLQSTTADWDEVRSHFKRTFDRVVARGPEGRYAPHPLFGPLKSGLWGVLMYRHIDHHLQQFGE